MQNKAASKFLSVYTVVGLELGIPWFTDTKEKVMQALRHMGYKCLSETLDRFSTPTEPDDVVTVKVAI